MTNGDMTDDGNEVTNGIFTWFTQRHGVEAHLAVGCAVVGCLVGLAVGCLVGLDVGCLVGLRRNVGFAFFDEVCVIMHHTNERKLT